jgi:hypothetical protein
MPKLADRGIRRTFGGCARSFVMAKAAMCLQRAKLPLFALFLYDSATLRPVIAVRFTCESNARAEET